MSIVSEELLPIDEGLLPTKEQSNRYFLSKAYQEGSNVFFETWEAPEIPVTSKDKFHEITSGEEGRWDLISYEHYGSVLGWWIICLANGVSNPFDIKPAGTVVRIPPKEMIYTISQGYKMERAEYKVY
jgi:hypothetical protein